MNGVDLRDRVVVVTGASRGIGKGLAIGLAGLGARVVCAARTIEPGTSEFAGSVRETVDEICAAGHSATAVRCDIGVDRDVVGLVEHAITEFGALDVLVNNAMTPTRAPFLESDVAMWDDSMRINVRSLYVLTRAVTPQMEKQGGGSIINISSGAAAHEVSALMPPGYVIYSVAKAALERFSTAVAPEVRPLGITVNALRPGAVKTEHTASEFGPDFDWSGWAEPADVVPPVAYLAAQIGTDVTGNVFDVADFGTRWGR